MTHLRKILAIPLIGLLLVVGAAGTAAAHERVEVADGKYQLIVGWKNEPPYAGLKNGLDLGVNRILPAEHAEEEEGGHGHGHGAAAKTEPVKGLLGNLTVTYEIAGKTFSPPDWRGQHGRDGWYTAEITPTREGEYTVHIVGDIEGHAIDVRVKPHAIESYGPTMFPAPDLTPEETGEALAALEAENKDLSTKLAALEKQVGDLKTELGTLKTKAQSEKPETKPVESPKATPGPGLLLGALALALVAVVARNRK